MKKALILGTSHSVSICKKDVNDDWRTSRLEEGRWHDYLQTELGYEVTNISAGGANPSMQLAALTMYLSNHPDETWDLALLEGRSTEPYINIPDVYKDYGRIYFSENLEDSRILNTDLVKHEVDYSYDINKFGMANYSPLQKNAKNHNGLFETVTKYCHSIPHSIEVHGLNRAILTLLETRAKTVKMWKYSSVVDYLSIEGKWEKYFFQEWCSQYQLFPNKKNQIYGIKIEDPLLLCACKHLNEEGHKYIWQNHIKPALEILNL